MTEVAASTAQRGQRASTKSLTSSTISNFLWMFSGAGAETIFKILVLSVLARLLTPAEFGVVSAALSVVALAELFARSGVAPAIVQLPTITDDHIRTAFTITLIGPVLVALIVFASSGPISSLFNMPAMQEYVAALSVIFLFRGAGLVSESLLQREHRFRTIAGLSLLSYVLGYAGVSIIFSMYGFGAWELVFGSVAQAAMLSVFYNVAGRHSFRPAIVRSAFWPLMNFGAGFTLTRIGNFIALNADYSLSDACWEPRRSATTREPITCFGSRRSSSAPSATG